MEQDSIHTALAVRAVSADRGTSKSCVDGWAKHLVATAKDAAAAIQHPERLSKEMGRGWTIMISQIGTATYTTMAECSRAVSPRPAVLAEMATVFSFTEYR